MVRSTIVTENEILYFYTAYFNFQQDTYNSAGVVPIKPPPVLLKGEFQIQLNLREQGQPVGCFRINVCAK